MCRLKEIIFSFSFILLLNTPLYAANKTLSEILKSFFDENNICIIETKWKEIDLLGLWNSLGIDPDDVNDGKRADLSYSQVAEKIDSGEKIVVDYRVHMSGGVNRGYNEYVILELRLRHCFKDKQPCQLLLFQKKDENWFFIGDYFVPHEWFELEINFYETPDSSLLFSVIRTAGRGTGHFLAEWTFYKFIDGEIKKVLTTYNNSFTGTLMRLDRCYETRLWPASYIWPDIAMTYFVMYNTKGSYWDMEEIGEVRLVALTRDVFYTWDEKEKIFLFNAKLSEASPKEVNEMLSYGCNKILAKFNKEVEGLKRSGSSSQKECIRKIELSLKERRDDLD